jgi:hypothetical protein
MTGLIFCSTLIQIVDAPVLKHVSALSSHFAFNINIQVRNVSWSYRKPYKSVGQKFISTFYKCKVSYQTRKSFTAVLQNKVTYVL